MRAIFYGLDDAGNPVPISPRDGKSVERAWSDDRRQVAEDFVGPYHVSTVFLPIDHNHTFGGPPILWETLVFREEAHGEAGGKAVGAEDMELTPVIDLGPGGGNTSILSVFLDTSEFKRRYASRADAVKGHAETVTLLVEKLGRFLPEKL